MGRSTIVFERRAGSPLATHMTQFYHRASIHWIDPARETVDQLNNHNGTVTAARLVATGRRSDSQFRLTY